MRLRRRAVDLVGQDDVGENRPLDEAEFTPACLRFVENRRAGDVRGHQVRRKLDALEADIQNLADRADHQGLGQAGHADKQAMPAREDGGQDLLDHVGLADDDAAELFEHEAARLAELAEIFADAIGRHR